MAQVPRAKILFVINSLAGGGAERVMTTLLGGSQRYAERYEIVLVLLDRETEAYALPEWLRVIRLDCRHSLARSIRSLWRVVADERPQMALSFLTRANVATAAAMAPRRLPFVLSERVNTTAHLGTGGAAALSKLMVRLSYPRATRVIAVSAGVGDTLVSDFGVGAGRIVAIPNPVDLDGIQVAAQQPPPIAIDGRYVIGIGRLVPNKNFALAIEAFVRSGMDGSLVLLGEGPERERLRTLGDRLGLGPRLILTGFVDNPYAMLSRASFFVLSSNAEGFPNALVEALASGVATVATDCRSGPSEVLATTITDASGTARGRGGLLVSVDDVDAMTEAFRQMKDAGLRNELATLGRERVMDFGVDRAVGRYWDVLEDALGGGPR